MVKGALKTPGLWLLLGGVCAAGAACAADAAGAAQAAKSTPAPDYAALWQGEAVTQWKNANTGSTSYVEALRQDGRGALFAPGRQEADRCAPETDPHCRAVQIVDKKGGVPGIDPDVSGSLMDGRDDIVGKAEDLVDLTGTGSSAGACRPVTSTVTTPGEVKTCARQVLTEDKPVAVEHACYERWEDIMAESSRWLCEMTHRTQASYTCHVEQLLRQKGTATLTCYEGKKDAETRTCPVTVTAKEEHRYLASCTRPRYTKSTRECTQVLTVVPSATCTIGEVVAVEQTDTSIMTQDATDGLDTFRMEYVCKDAKNPTIRLGTNNHTKGGVDQWIETVDSTIEKWYRRTYGQVWYSGHNTCEGTTCTALVTMTAYEGETPNFVYTGAITLRLVYTKFQKLDETEHWTTTCTGEGS